MPRRVRRQQRPSPGEPESTRMRTCGARGACRIQLGWSEYLRQARTSSCPGGNRDCQKNVTPFPAEGKVSAGIRGWVLPRREYRSNLERQRSRVLLRERDTGDL